MIMRKVVGLFFFSSESHPEHMSHPAYQKLPPLCLCLVEIREKRKQMQKNPKKNQLVFVCFIFLCCFFYFVYQVTCNSEDRAKYVRSFASSFFFELVQVLNGKVFVPQPDVIQFVSGIRFIISSHTSQDCFFKIWLAKDQSANFWQRCQK